MKDEINQSLNQILNAKDQKSFLSDASKSKQQPIDELDSAIMPVES